MGGEDRRKRSSAKKGSQGGGNKKKESENAKPGKRWAGRKKELYRLHGRRMAKEKNDHASPRIEK